MDQHRVIETITEALRDREEIRALFLSGSHGNGLADAYSDIDFIMVTADGASDGVAALWREAVARTGEIVLWWDRRTVPVLINAITEDWTRTDVLMLKPDQMERQRQDMLKVLFDRDAIFERLPATSPPATPDPKRQRYQVEEFIRILGLLPLAIGREEYLNGVLGVFHLRNLLVDLMVEETGAPNRGGVLHLNRLITEEQKAVLTALPVPEPTRDGIVAAHLAYAGAYLPRARRLAGVWGVEWPARFEDVMWQRLGETLGIERSV